MDEITKQPESEAAPHSEETPKDQDQKPVDRVAQIAEEKLAELKAKAEEESKGASTEDGGDSEKEKTEEDDKTKKVEEKVEKRKRELQGEIDGLVKQVKTLEEQYGSTEALAKKLEAMEAELAELRESHPKEPPEEKASRIESERIAKFLEEDKEKPREERREMSKEELDDWYLEDPVSATEWIQRRELRRYEERKSSEVKPKEIQQSESEKALLTKYPGVNQGERINALVAEGKSKEDAIKTVMAESKEFKVLLEIYKENPTKYSDPKDGPALVLAEMDKRLGETKKSYTADEVEKAKEEAARAERERLSRIDGLPEGGGKENSMVKNPNYDLGLETFLKAAKRTGKNWTKDDYDKVIKRRSGIVGANDPEVLLKKAGVK